MATGGIFQLITNDGKQDKMLMASDLLKQRLAAAAGKTGGPTLFDIEQTHILFTNAHFKPFAAIGFEYNKVSASSASGCGGEATFSIPQFGDFFSDMVLHVIINQPVWPANNSGMPRTNLMRWCDYPGEQLLRQVSFEVNGNPLDKYSQYAVNLHREFSLPPNKVLAWNRCMGQEEVQEGFVDQPVWTGSGVDPNAVLYRSKVSGCSGLQTPTGVKTEPVELFIPLLFWCNKDPRLAIPSVAIPYGQRFIKVSFAAANQMVGEVPGNPDATKSMWDPSNFSESHQKLNLSPMSQFATLELYINNIFVNPEVHNIFIKRVGFTLIRVHKEQISTLKSADSLLLSNLKWPIEAMFVGARPDAYCTSVDPANRQYLDKWYKFCSVVDEKRSMQGWHSQKAHVTNYLGFCSPANSSLAVQKSYVLGIGSSVQFGGMYAGKCLTLTFPTLPNYALTNGSVVNFTTPSTPTMAAKSYSLTVAGSNVDGYATLVSFTVDSTDASVEGLPGKLFEPGSDVSKLSVVYMSSEEMSYTVQTPTPILGSVGITAHGIPIYSQYNSAFYNAYLPYTYGGPNVMTPKDLGALMVTFCLYPGTYQPSGHINVSRAREFYINYAVNPSSGLTGNSAPAASLIVLASAINFLLISDGSAVLRYST